jgi:exodeoxyribonuclease (lambda-induced)
MALIVHTDPQGSEAWLAARRGIPTGSRFKDCRDYLKPTAAEVKAGATRGKPSAKLLGYAMDLARERVGGHVPPVFQTAAMRTGHIEEPKARLAYEEETGNIVIEAGFITTEDRRWGVSVDGLVKPKGGIEVKTMVSSATLFKAVVEGDISEYIDQINGAILLLELDWLDLVLWAPDLAHLGRGLTIRRIWRDEAAIRALEADLLTFVALVNDFEAALRAPAVETEGAF